MKKFVKSSHNNRTSFKNFQIFDSLNENYICLETNKNLLQQFIYPNVVFNLDFKKDFFYKYFLKKHLDTAILMGGCFTSYKSNSELSKKYNELSDLFNLNQEYAIYFLGDDAEVLAKYYAFNFKHLPFFKDSGSFHNNLSFPRIIKAKLDNHFVNAVFLQRSDKKEINFLQHFFEKMDIRSVISEKLTCEGNLGKIFYCFKIKKTFMLHSLFECFSPIQVCVGCRYCEGRPKNEACVYTCNNINFYSKDCLEAPITRLCKNKNFLTAIKHNIKYLGKYFNFSKIFLSKKSFEEKHLVLIRLLDNLPHRCFERSDLTYKNQFCLFKNFFWYDFMYYFKTFFKGEYEENSIYFFIDIFYLVIKKKEVIKKNGEKYEQLILDEIFYESLLNFYFN